MNGHINGWTVISRHLQLREKNQSDLARLLHISPAAITQIKNGQFRLNPRQLRIIPNYLEFSQSACDEFFSEIFNARMHFCHGEYLQESDHIRCIVKVEHSSGNRKIPVAPLHVLKNFIPALEPIVDFMKRMTPERHHCSCRSGAVALKVDGELMGSSSNALVIVNGDSYPVNGEPAIAAWEDGTFTAGTYSSSNDERRILPFSSRPKPRNAESLRWIYPIIREEVLNA